MVVTYEALVHALVVLLDALDSEHGFLVSQGLSILKPGDGLDGVALDVAGEGGWPTEVDGLTPGLDLSGQRRGYGQDGLDALASNRVVHYAKVLARVFHLGLEDYKGTADLANAVVQLNRLTTRRSLDEFVPSEIQKFQLFIILSR